MKNKLSRRYLAGLMDGEGYISILPPSKKEGDRFYFKPIIKIGMSSPEVIKEIYLLFGGQLYVKQRDNPIHKEVLVCSFSTFSSVTKILDYIHPYLIVKKPQADVLRLFLNTKQTEVGRSHTINESLLLERQRLYSLMRQLNRRGCVPAETKCKPPVKQDEVIVRPALKNAEIIRNDNPTSFN